MRGSGKSRGRTKGGGAVEARCEPFALEFNDLTLGTCSVLVLGDGRGEARRGILISALASGFLKGSSLGEGGLDSMILGVEGRGGSSGVIDPATLESEKGPEVTVEAESTVPIEA